MSFRMPRIGRAARRSRLYTITCNEACRITATFEFATAEEIREKRGRRSWYENDQSAAEVMSSGRGDGKNFGWG